MNYLEEKNRSKVIGIIPARYASTRFPGKPLALINGEPMIIHTYRNARKGRSSLDKLVVATDHSDILNCMHREFGYDSAIMTPIDCENGTVRCLKAYQKLKQEGLIDDTYHHVINIQGDEPLVNWRHITELVKLLKQGDAPMVALASPLTDEAEARSSATTKVVMDRNGFMLYASRALIPSSKTGQFRGATYYKNCGMYGYHIEFLEKYCQEKQTPCQIEEDLEQLKAIELGYRIKMGIIDYHEGGIDLPEQLEALNRRWKYL